MASSSSLYNYVVPQGLIVADTSTIQAEVTAEYLAAFGDDLITTPNSPAGLLIAAETIARSAVVNNNVAVANQINPNIAGGVFLDAICALTGVVRVGATFTVVNATITGVAGTFIAAGSLASESISQALFKLAQDVTIPDSGTVAGIFASVLPGAIPCGAGNLTQIVSNLIGWLTVNNVDPGTLGALSEPDQQLRDDRITEIFAQGSSTAGAIIANVAVLPGYNSMQLIENDADNITQLGIIDGSTHNVTGLGNTTTLSVGMLVTATGIPADTFIASIVSTSAITLTNNTTSAHTESILFQQVLGGEPGQPLTGVAMTSHSIYCCVADETASNIDIATAIAQKKSAGCGYTNGASMRPVSQVVVQPQSGQSMTVLFDRPDLISCVAYVTVSQGTSPITQLALAVQAACYNYAQGVNGVTGALGVGDALSAFELAGAITAAIPGVYVSNVQVALAATPATKVNVIPATIWQQNYFANFGAITVTVIT